jgi:hypothetical protein
MCLTICINVKIQSPQCRIAADIKNCEDMLLFRSCALILSNKRFKCCLHLFVLAFVRLYFCPLRDR